MPSHVVYYLHNYNRAFMLMQLASYIVCCSYHACSIIIIIIIIYFTGLGTEGHTQEAEPAQDVYP